MIKSLGINVGAVSLKIACIYEDKTIFDCISHEGNIFNSVISLFEKHSIPNNIPALVTGSEGRFLFNMKSVPELVCVEKMLAMSHIAYNAVVSLGGEDIVVYLCSKNKTVVNSMSGNKCASGTGEFFKQQLGRMDIKLEDIHNLKPGSKALKLSKRCSVFMKSDCTHRLNKGQASKDDIVLSLSALMASKVAEYLRKMNVVEGNVLLGGGLTQNKHIVSFLKEILPKVQFHVPENAVFIEALGAAYLAQTEGELLPRAEHLFNYETNLFKSFSDLKAASSLVKVISLPPSQVEKGAEYALGIDGGSTTTKACLVDIHTNHIVAQHYARTHGDPVKALKECLSEINRQVEKYCFLNEIRVSIVSTTGSSREILGLFTNTTAVYNEIMAHGCGTSHFYKEIDTVFEIGGQDAKYIYMHNGVPVDYTMNEACSAGTGSFLEEAAAGDLNITEVEKIGPLALASQKPLKFGEHCAAFINAEIRKAILQGASKEDITAGLVLSIVSNYLNRVVGNRTIGNHISIQGGVAKNPAVPLAIAYLLNKEVVVPPVPELLGCFGAALIAVKKHKEGLLEKKHIDLKSFLNKEFKIEKYFTCKACDNYCSIAVIDTDTDKLMFGGRCNKYANSQKKHIIKGHNYVESIQKIIFAQDTHSVKPKMSIGIPKCFSVYNLFPLIRTFFEEIGCEVVLSDKVHEVGLEKVESDYCFPAEIAHGAVYDILMKETDYIFLPHLKEIVFENNAPHACFCPITQALPYYISQAFPEIDRDRLLIPEISIRLDHEALMVEFVRMAEQLSVKKSEARRAFTKAWHTQEKISMLLKNNGKDWLSSSAENNKPVIVLMGRPYNAFTSDANMGIPEKFVSRGVDILPFDILPIHNDKTVSYDNMYWYYGQQLLDAAFLCKEKPHLFPVFITNFSCAPDSFILHYVRWIMGSKPFLILELDSHTADAGIDTRIEAYLDVVESYMNNKPIDRQTSFDNGLRFINKNDEIYIYNEKLKTKTEIRNNADVVILLSNMGRYSTELFAASIKSYGIEATALPKADEFTVQIAKKLTSGKECLPAHLVLGSLLQFVNSKAYSNDKIYMLFVPTTTGPCRTGQYFVFYEKIIQSLGLSNVVIFTLDSDNSYRELGKGFTKNGWWGLALADYIKDIEIVLRTCARNKEEALMLFEEQWQKIIKVAEKDIKTVAPILKETAALLSQISLKNTPKDLQKVLVVGEIYVRRDDFAVNELVEMLSNHNVLCKIAGITEWLFYCDYVRKIEIKKQLKKEFLLVRPFNKVYVEKLNWHIENLYKHQVESVIKKALLPSGLLIDFPADMDLIMNNCEKLFIKNNLFSEISISSGVASTALMDGYAGVVNISPFACLIGRVIEGIIKPWARSHNYPLLSVEIDGSALPINTINKLEIFISNVKRKSKENAF